jgi:hypothetical protein
MRCAVPDQFDLLGPADGFTDLLTAQAGTRAGSADVASWASRAPWIAGGAVAGSAAHARKALLLICPGGQPSGTASWGFNSVSWGFNSAFMVIWAGLQSRGGGAENAGQQRKAVTALS